MQLYALENTIPIAAKAAKKGETYLCPECKAKVRVRGGPFRQIHFYHLSTPGHCRQYQKSLEHLQLQLKILNLIDGAEIECSFPPIQRIADVAWHTKKIVFEIQCSPITLEEAQKRNLDYRFMGYEVIWILHEKQFNQKKLSAAENYLRSTPCYFTNINKIAEGIVYDQFEVIQGNRRLFKGPKLPLSVTAVNTLPEISLPDIELPKILMERLANWKCYAHKDLLHRWLQERNLSLSAKNMLNLEKRWLEIPNARVRLPIKTLLVKSYRYFLDTLIKRL